MTKDELWDRVCDLSYYYYYYDSHVIENSVRHMNKLIYGLDSEPEYQVEMGDNYHTLKEFDELMNQFVDNKWLIPTVDGCYYIVNPLCYKDRSDEKD